MHNGSPGAAAGPPPSPAPGSPAPTAPPGPGMAPALAAPSGQAAPLSAAAGSTPDPAAGSPDPAAPPSAAAGSTPDPAAGSPDPAAPPSAAAGTTPSPAPTSPDPAALRPAPPSAPRPVRPRPRQTPPRCRVSWRRPSCPWSGVNRRQPRLPPWLPFWPFVLVPGPHRPMLPHRRGRAVPDGQTDPGCCASRSLPAQAAGAPVPVRASPRAPGTVWAGARSRLKTAADLQSSSGPRTQPRWARRARSLSSAVMNSVPRRSASAR